MDLPTIASRLEALEARVEAGLLGVQDRFNALDRGLVLAHTQQEFQSVAATALAVSAADLQRADRLKTLRELEAKGKALMAHLQELQAKHQEEDGFSEIAAEDRQLDRVEVPRALAPVAAGPPRAIRAVGAGLDDVARNVREAGGALDQLLSDVVRSTTLQVSALQSTTERRLDAVQVELRALSTGVDEKRRQDFDRFLEEIRRELEGIKESQSMSTSENKEIKVLTSRVVMNKIELTARLAMVEGTLQKSQVASMQPRIERAELLLDEVAARAHAAGNPLPQTKDLGLKYQRSVTTNNSLRVAGMSPISSAVGVSTPSTAADTGAETNL